MGLVGPDDDDENEVYVEFKDRIPNFSVRPSFLMIDPSKRFGESEFASAADMLSWEILRACIQVAGGEVKVLEPTKTPGISGETFVQDPFAVIPELKVAIGSLSNTFNAKNDRRDLAAEQDRLHADIERQSYKILTIPPRIEGGNILYHAPSKTLFQGCFSNEPGSLGTEEARNALEKALQQIDPEITVMTVPIVKEQNRRHAFHLDQCMSILPYGEILIDKNLVSPETLANIDAKVGKDNVCPNETVGNGHNIVAVGPTLITEEMPFGMKCFLENRGYNVVTPGETLANANEIFIPIWDKLEENGAIERFLKDPRILSVPGGDMTRAVMPRDAKLLQREIMRAFGYRNDSRLKFGGLEDGGPHCISLKVDNGQAPELTKTVKSTAVEKPIFDRARMKL